jgi:hypothetical protein
VKGYQGIGAAAGTSAARRRSPISPSPAVATRPRAGRALADLILTGSAKIALDAFAPERFAR